MKTRFLALLCALCVVIMASMVACSSDESPSAQAGNGGSSASGSGGQAGGMAGNGGTAGSAGSAANGWKKGVVGKATKGAVVLATGAGQAQGFSLNNGQKTTSLQTGAIGGINANTKGFNFGGHLPNLDGGVGMKPMDLPGDGGDADLDADTDAATADADLDAGDGSSGGVNTAPVVDFSQINPDFTELWVPIPPYAAVDMTPLAPPRIAVIKPDGTTSVLEPFGPNWMNDFPINGLGGLPTMVNGVDMRSYGGFGLDSTDCLNRHFWISNLSTTIQELFGDGTKQPVATYSAPLSSIICHPGGYLIATSLPQYSYEPGVDLPIVGPSILKIKLDGSPIETIATLPVGDDYARRGINVEVIANWPTAGNASPIAMRIPLSISPQGDYIVADSGGRKVYSVTETGTYQVKMDVSPYTVAIITAPNEVIYLIDAPIIGHFSNGDPPVLLQAPAIRAWDGQQWIEILTLPKYTTTALGTEYYISCPAIYANSADTCTMPTGIFAKMAPGATPILYIMDPVSGTFYGAPLDTGTNDAGGAGGSSGSGGEAGSAGTAGTAPDASDDASAD